MSQRKYTFHTLLKSLPRVEESIYNASNNESETKKTARIRASVRHTSSRLGFIHGALIAIGAENFIIAGPSGIGKSTLAQKILEKVDGRLLANDWVAIERCDDKYYASDLNVKNAIKHHRPVLVSGIIFLCRDSIYHRDAFAPNNQEFAHLLEDLFDDMEKGDVVSLSSFWLSNRESLPMYFALNRGYSPEYTAQTLLVVLSRLRPTDTPVQVGIIGVGSVGSALASEMGRYSYVQKVHLYSRSKKKTAGIAIDLNQALRGNREDIYVAHDSVEDLFNRSSVVFLALRVTEGELEKGVPERWRKVKLHTEAIAKYSEIAAKVDFRGTIFIVTNPVDFLTFAYYKTSQTDSDLAQRTFQVYGVGLEGDLARAVFFGRKQYAGLSLSDIDILGSHADEFEMKIPGLDVKLEDVTKQVIGASKEVRSYAVRTIYGPVAAACRSFEAYLNNSSTHLTLVLQDSYFGCRITFKNSLPIIDSNTAFCVADHQKYIDHNKQKIQIYSRILS